MVSYLDIPQETIKTYEQFIWMLPDYDSLTEWQQIQYETMLYGLMYHQESEGVYDWSSGHDGCPTDVYYQGTRILRAAEGCRTHCVGFSFWHFLLSRLDWLEHYSTEERDMSVEHLRQLKAYWFVYKDNPPTYFDGAPRGMELTSRHLLDLNPELSYEYVYHTDPYQAQFGDYIQFQSKPSPIENNSGHSVIFIGLEKRTYQGREIDVIRAVQSNSRNDYGMSPGIGFGWFIIDKVDVKTQFRRICKFGGLRPRGAYVS
jgi:hypothetical protein